jgi:hypothetical protein
LNYRELLGGDPSSQDVLPATAARISASFPYISPFTKPAQPTPLGRAVALCDGGYVDNEGIVTAVTWIEYLLRHRFDELNSKEKSGDGNSGGGSEKRDHTFDRILLLRIEPALSRENEMGPGGFDPMNYLRWLVGPVEAMMNVRSTSQVERGHLEADLTQFYFDLSGASLSEEKFAPQKSVASAQQDESQTSLSIPRNLKEAQTARQKWNEELKDFETEFKAKVKTGEIKTKQSPSEREPLVYRRRTSSDVNSIVIVESVPFYDAYQVIPLNWKLSKIEKLGYLYSWKQISGPLRCTLDRYFTRREPNAELQLLNP